MIFQGLLLESPDFKLSGVGAVDMLGAQLNGEFELSLSRELSASMRAENSRAGELFWNGSNQQVEVPFSLEGPFTAPSPRVDWNSVVETAIRGRAEDEIRKYLVRQLGGGGEREPQTRTTPPETLVPSETASANRGTTEPSSGLEIELSKIGWGGSFLLPDLEMEGALHGAGIEHAEVSVVDSRGTEIQRDRLTDVERFMARVADRSERVSIRWKYEVDGKKLLGVRFPVSVRITAYDTDGRKTEQVVED
jgi:hypothetical protein